MASWIIPWINATAYVLLIVFNIVRFNHQSPASVSHQYPTSFTPRDYTFAIWGPIFFGLGLLTVLQMLRVNRRLSIALFRFGLPLNLLVAGPIWNFFFSYELLSFSLFFMLVLFFTLVSLLINVRMHKHIHLHPHAHAIQKKGVTERTPMLAQADQQHPQQQRSQQQQTALSTEPDQTLSIKNAAWWDININHTVKFLLVDLVIDVYLGWIAVATLANCAVVGSSANISLFGNQWFAAFVLACLTPVFCAAHVLTCSFFPLASAWGIAGIAFGMDDIATCLFVLACALSIVTFVCVYAYRHPEGKKKADSPALVEGGATLFV